jgi:hypothetical protein
VVQEALVAEAALMVILDALKSAAVAAEVVAALLVRAGTTVTEAQVARSGAAATGYVKRTWRRTN